MAWNRLLRPCVIEIFILHCMITQTLTKREREKERQNNTTQHKT